METTHNWGHYDYEKNNPRVKFPILGDRIGKCVVLGVGGTSGYRVMQCDCGIMFAADVRHFKFGTGCIDCRKDRIGKMMKYSKVISFIGLGKYVVQCLRCNCYIIKSWYDIEKLSRFDGGEGCHCTSNFSCDYILGPANVTITLTEYAGWRDGFNYYRMSCRCGQKLCMPIEYMRGRTSCGCRRLDYEVPFQQPISPISKDKAISLRCMYQSGAYTIQQLLISNKIPLQTLAGLLANKRVQFRNGEITPDNMLKLSDKRIRQEGLNEAV